jgi:hypothetical protein
MSHAPHADANDPFQKRTAVSIALFTTILALASMLTNQARTQAILSSNRATNKWSHYQSKSTKQQLVKLEQSLSAHIPVLELAKSEGERITAELARYDLEKNAIRQEAEGLAAQEREAEHKEHYYEYSATVAELAIILASIALLMTSRKALYASFIVAFAALLLMGYTTFALHPPNAETVLVGPH